MKKASVVLVEDSRSEDEESPSGSSMPHGISQARWAMQGHRLVPLSTDANANRSNSPEP